MNDFLLSVQVRTCGAQIEYSQPHPYRKDVWRSVWWRKWRYMKKKKDCLLKRRETYLPWYKTHMGVPRSQTFPLAHHHRICKLAYRKKPQPACIALKC